MVIDDDRTDEEKNTHWLAVVGTDRFMSGWGKAEGGVSYAAWACPFSRQANVERWVKSRGDQMRVRVVILDGYRPRGTGHLHIYVVREGHQAWDF